MATPISTLPEPAVFSVPPRDTAWRAQKEIHKQLHLDASLGVAANKMVSRIASEISKPLGLQDVRPGDESSFLSPLPVRLLPGVGPQARHPLDELNIRIIRDLVQMKIEHLTFVFGRLGFVLFQRARGIDNTPVYPERTVPAIEQEKMLPKTATITLCLKTCSLNCAKKLASSCGRRSNAQGVWNCAFDTPITGKTVGKKHSCPLAIDCRTLCPRSAVSGEDPNAAHTRAQPASALGEPDRVACSWNCLPIRRP